MRFKGEPDLVLVRGRIGRRTGTRGVVGMGVIVGESRNSIATVLDSAAGHFPHDPRAKTCRQARQKRYRGGGTGRVDGVLLVNVTGVINFLA